MKTILRRYCFGFATAFPREKRGWTANLACHCDSGGSDRLLVHRGAGFRVVYSHRRGGRHHYFGGGRRRGGLFLADGVYRYKRRRF
ncbi:hypothetical protein SDC9_105688 [bioreactor metagenome]|uniref:Uncharacterized protein n=1 Tax=bioreactor metagenome TaxID=1076179 RepID=A0A645B056_9ZZZZ